MARPLHPLDFVGAVACMGVSSWLGLTGRLNGALPTEESFRFFGAVWGDSLAADAMFAGGSILLFLAAFWFVRQQRSQNQVFAAFGIGLAGFMLHLLVYEMSFLLLSNDMRGGARDSLRVVLEIGIVGLLWCIVAPAVAVAWIRKTSSAPVPATPASPGR
ncbi:MAG: hypothetical protein QOD77_330 [Thermoplasmata archaeon]|jgi:hypothetical protein|nr:hypothetical protein [Thermoplasmata archaeon]